MEDFFEYSNDSNKKKRNNLKGYIAVALISVILTSIFTLLILPLAGTAWKKQETAIRDLINSDKQIEDKWADNEELFSQKKAPLIGGDNPVVDIAKEVGPTVVGITSSVRVEDGFLIGERPQGSGSGVIFNDKGYIVTNNHVIEGSTEVVVVLPGGKQVKAAIIGRDFKSDLAVLKINEEDLKIANFGDSDDLQVGELVVAIGNPLGHQLAGTVTVGVISSIDRNLLVDGRQMSLIQTDAAINPGNSGGPLVNSRGEVIAINTLKSLGAGVEGIGFAIPINEAKPIIENLMKNGYVSRPAIGIHGGTLDEEKAKDSGYPIGAYVDRVLVDGPAAKAGIMPDDVIIEIKGKRITTFEELQNALESMKTGDSLNVTVWRNNKQFKTDIVLGEYNEMFTP